MGNDHHPFGMLLVGRTFDVNYRYGFNGKEHDTDPYGQGNVYDYGFRIYNPRLGKFLSVDPLGNQYPWYSTFQFAGNNPIKFVDLDGLEKHNPAGAAQRARGLINQGCSDPNEVLLRNTTPSNPGQTPPQTFPG